MKLVFRKILWHSWVFYFIFLIFFHVEAERHRTADEEREEEKTDEE
jgi:hypothetical protein